MYKKNPSGWMKHADFMVLDVVSFIIAFFLADFLRHGSFVSFENRLYMNMFSVGILSTLFVMLFLETFKNVRRRGYYQEFKRTFQQAGVVLLLMTFYLVAQKEAEDFSRVVLVLCGIIYFALSYVTRQWWKKRLNERRKRAQSRTMILVTTQDQLQNMVDQIQNHRFEDFKIIGISVPDLQSNEEQINDIPLIPFGKQFYDHICRAWVDEVFVDATVPMQDYEELTDVLNSMGVVTHRKLADSSNQTGRKQFVEKMNGYQVMTTSINYASTRQLILKRSMDILGGLVGCLIAGLIFIVVAPLIKIQSPGPVFYKQERIGRNGKRFHLIKFRSMYMDADERKKELMAQNKLDTDLMFKLDKDPRIIGSKLLPDGTYKKGIGNFIRDWSLDEFPQFFNVLRGDMSLVGTRPPTVDEWNKYELHHRARLAIKPGITGMWQTSGRSEITDFEEVVRLDTEYINNWNFGLDIKLLLKTVAVVLHREGSM